MAFANGSQTRIAYVAESTFGTTPSNPVFKTLRARSSTLRPNKGVLTSDELRADRNIADEVRTNISVSGEVVGELAYGAWDDILAGALQGTWSTNVLKNGGTAQFFTFEETSELGATDSYQRYTGCMVNSLSMDINTRQIVTVSASLMGSAPSLGTAIVSGATYTAANTTAVQAAPAGIAGLNIAGISAKVRRLSWQVNNNLRERPVVDSLYSLEMGSGRCDVTGSIEAYFENNTLMQAILDHTSGAFSLTVGTVTNEKYTIAFPKAIFGDGQFGQRSQDTDVILTIPFRAVYDSGEACSIKITRAVA